MPLHNLLRLPALAVRRLRWARGGWSKDRDRHYHERLYETQDYDPFRPGYPGYVTIRRFADHAEALIPVDGTVLDIGCGPGEITCELARRHPNLAFIGVDHSAQAIARADANAARLGLTNIRFAVGDAEQLPPGDRYGLVTMFDAFHHLERPEAFLTWLAARTSRCVLIEPAGTWTGRWARGVDVDWLLSDLANIRDRLEAACGEPIAGQAAGAAPSAGPVVDTVDAGSLSRDPALEQGEGAVERRYALDDFVGFFAGWQLRVTGTIAGIDRYPPLPHAESALRPIAGEAAYALMRAAEELLVSRDRDGAAKHWVVAATTETGVLRPRLPPAATAAEPAHAGRPVASAFDVTYRQYDGPEHVDAGAPFRVTIEVVNDGWDDWRSDGEHPVRASYHWLTIAGDMAAFDGLRTDLPRAIGPGQTCRMPLDVAAPAAAGRYVLAIDLVKEGVTWFSQAGSPWHAAVVEVS